MEQPQQLHTRISRVCGITGMYDTSDPAEQRRSRLQQPHATANDQQYRDAAIVSTRPIESMTSSSSAEARVVPLPHVSPTPPEPATSFYIRNSQPSDTAAVHGLFAYAQAEYGNSDDYVTYAIAHDLSDIEQHYVNAPRSAFYCAVDTASQSLLGIVGIRPLAIGDTDYYNECMACEHPSTAVPFEPHTTAELNRMAVAPHARRRGIARALIHRCLSFCHSCHYSHLHLSTLATMTQAVAFYTSCGFHRYRTDRQNWMNDVRIGTDTMRRVYVERGEREEDRTKCWIVDSEVPVDEATGLEMRERGIYFQCHFIISVEKWAARANAAQAEAESYNASQ